MGNQMKNLLLEKAKAVKAIKAKGTDITADLIGLAIAWAKDEVTFTQVNVAINGSKDSTMSSYIHLSRALRQAIRNGQLIVKK